MDKEDHRRFMPPGYRSFEENIKLGCAICHYGIDIDAKNIPLQGQITGIDLDFPPDQHGPLTLIICPNCKVNFIAPKKSWRFNCKSCGRDQPLMQNYEHLIDHEDEKAKKGIETGSLNSQVCSFCNTTNNHQFLIEKGLSIFELIRSINPDCKTSDDYLDNAKTWYWLKRYDLSYESLLKVDLELLHRDKNPNRAFNNCILIGNVLSMLRKNEEVPPWYQKALKIKPDNPTALHLLGISYFNLQQWDDAEKPYEKIINENIQVSDMIVDNAILKHRTMHALVMINHHAGNADKKTYWESKINQLIKDNPFLENYL